MAHQERKPRKLPARCCAASENRIPALAKRGFYSLVIVICAMTFAIPPTAGRADVADVTIGVFGLFHPRELTVAVAGDSALVVHAGHREIVLERSSGLSAARLALVHGAVLLTAGTHVIRTSQLTVTGRGNGPAEFELAVPARIRRRYRGVLKVQPAGASLLPIIAMDLEGAVASVVAAESSPDTPLEALKAQAVAARSYFVAGRGRHRDFDFCDTTHCQFLREEPAPNSHAAKAAYATRGLVLAYDSHVITAMYTRSCSGRTHTPTEVGLPAGLYPYYSVACSYCRNHPLRWSSRISKHDAALLRPSDEASRLEVIRRLGSRAVPSNDFVMKEKEDDGRVTLEGIGQGHGIGLCQRGAQAMAAEGADFRRILSHYYPNTTIENAGGSD